MYMYNTCILVVLLTHERVDPDANPKYGFKICVFTMPRKKLILSAFAIYKCFMIEIYVRHQQIRCLLDFIFWDGSTGSKFHCTNRCTTSLMFTNKIAGKSQY